MSFAALLDTAEPLAQGLALTVPEDWHQGRTAYGGFSSALALAAVQRLDPGLPPLRSAQLGMIAPVFGAVEVSAAILRQGRNAVWASAEIRREGAVCFAANFVFMRPIDSVLALNERPAPEPRVPVDEARPFTNPRAPAFLQAHFDVRFAMPRSAEKRPESSWWVRLRDRQGDALDPMVALLLCADALPPGVMPLLPPATPVSTMHWQVNLLTPRPATRDGWWLMHSSGDYAEQGCSSQAMAIWDADGVPVLAGMQSVALFG